MVRRRLPFWVWLRRVVPVVLVIAGVAGIILDFTGRLDKHGFERTVVLILGLIAIDSLIERFGLLEKIDANVKQITRPVGLKSRRALRTDELFANARSIDIAGVTLLNILHDRHTEFRELVTRGTHLRALLLDPSSPSWSAWTEAAKPDPAAAHLQAAEAHLEQLKKRRPDLVEFRYARYLLPTALVIVDRDQPSGWLVAELIFPDVDGGERPHVMFERREAPEWFNFFCDRFDEQWDRAGRESHQLPKPEPAGHEHVQV
ncbi:MAG TPA: hypothetical protein VFP80_15955 [Thermoanaerobaculia bacterium]|nr:hypothetical protein [Thermoanaerobaculia bacterium]